MKKIYFTSILFSFIAFYSCDKELPEDTSILGTWKITSITKTGLGSNNTNSLPFRNGTFIFKAGGIFIYINPSNVTFQGSWDIKSEFTAENDQYESLTITATSNNPPQTLSQYYNSVLFDNNRFSADINKDFATYTTLFTRQP